MLLIAQLRVISGSCPPQLVASCNSILWVAGNGCRFLHLQSRCNDMTMTNGETHNQTSWLKRAAVPVGIAAALFLFQSIWLAYILGAVCLSWSIWETTDKHSMLEHLAAYTFIFVIVVIPVVYYLHTNRYANLLSRDAEKYIQSIIDDGSERYCYMDSCR